MEASLHVVMSHLPEPPSLLLRQEIQKLEEALTEQLRRLKWELHSIQFCDGASGDKAQLEVKLTISSLLVEQKEEKQKSIKFKDASLQDLLTEKEPSHTAPELSEIERLEGELREKKAEELLKYFNEIRLEQNQKLLQANQLFHEFKTQARPPPLSAQPSIVYVQLSREQRMS